MINTKKYSNYCRIIGAGLLVSVLLINSGFAQQRSIQSNLNLKLASEYVFRGIAQSDEDPVLQADFSIFTPGNIYAGLWISNVDKPWGGVYNKGFSNEDIEYDVYLGYIGDIPNSKKKGKYDIGVIRYSYDPDDDDRSWTEAYIGVSHGKFAAKVSSRVEGAIMGEYLEGSYRGSFNKLFDYSLHYGYYILDERLRGFDDYADLSLGISKEINKYRVGITYFKNDKDGEGRYLDVADDRFVISVSKNFNLKKLFQKQ